MGTFNINNKSYNTEDFIYTDGIFNSPMYLRPVDNFIVPFFKYTSLDNAVFYIANDGALSPQELSPLTDYNTKEVSFVCEPRWSYTTNNKHSELMAFDSIQLKDDGTSAPISQYTIGTKNVISNNDTITTRVMDIDTGYHQESKSFVNFKYRGIILENISSWHDYKSYTWDIQANNNHSVTITCHRDDKTSDSYTLTPWKWGDDLIVAIQNVTAAPLALQAPDFTRTLAYGKSFETWMEEVTTATNTSAAFDEQKYDFTYDTAGDLYMTDNYFIPTVLRGDGLQQTFSLTSNKPTLVYRKLTINGDTSIKGITAQDIYSWSPVTDPISLYRAQANTFTKRPWSEVTNITNSTISFNYQAIDDITYLEEPIKADGNRYDNIGVVLQGYKRLYNYDIWDIRGGHEFDDLLDTTTESCIITSHEYPFLTTKILSPSQEIQTLTSEQFTWGKYTQDIHIYSGLVVNGISKLGCGTYFDIQLTGHLFNGVKGISGHMVEKERPTNLDGADFLYNAADNLSISLNGDTTSSIVSITDTGIYRIFNVNFNLIAAPDPYGIIFIKF